MSPTWLRPFRRDPGLRSAQRGVRTSVQVPRFGAETPRSTEWQPEQVLVRGYQNATREGAGLPKVPPPS